jgi:hypothetical protein
LFGSIYLFVLSDLCKWPLKEFLLQKLGDVQDLKDVMYRSNCQNNPSEDAFSVFELTNNAFIVLNLLPKLLKHTSAACCIVQSWNKTIVASTDMFQSLVSSACQQRASSNNVFDDLTSSESLNLLVFQLMGTLNYIICSHSN